MAMSRINVLGLVSDQFRSLRDANTGKPAIAVRSLVLVTGPIVAGFSYWRKWELHSISEIAAALGLLAGVFISAFAIVFSLRLTLAAKPTSNLKRRASRLMDESALTLLTAGLLAGVDAIWITIVSTTSSPSAPIGIWQSAITSGLSALVAVYFLLAIRRLHILYVDSFPPYWKVQKATEATAPLSVEKAIRVAAMRREKETRN
jgi:hypothetical protein